MRIIIFGTGAMACMFGARLSRVAQVTLLGTWAEGITAIRERGIRFDDCGESLNVPVQGEYLGAQVEPTAFAIVLVKSWQTKQIARHIANYLKPDGIAISLQNGLGNLELLGNRAFPGATAEGATLLGPGHVRAGGSGTTHIVAPEWAVELFKNAGFDCRRCGLDEVEGLLWGKLSVSCGINALTALLRVPNGELLKREDAENLMIRAAQECAGVAQARGIRLPFPDPAVRVREVAELTATNQSSMLQDILRGAPTECDAINGAVVREGKRLNVPTPVNEILWHLVRALINQSSPACACGVEGRRGVPPRMTGD
jgi:2-dehydropantoate 2-reductase